MRTDLLSLAIVVDAACVGVDAGRFLNLNRGHRGDSELATSEGESDAFHLCFDHFQRASKRLRYLL